MSNRQGDMNWHEQPCKAERKECVTEIRGTKMKVQRMRTEDKDGEYKR